MSNPCWEPYTSIFTGIYYYTVITLCSIFIMHIVAILLNAY